jgi:uncharacterized protein (TIGR00288 family)
MSENNITDNIAVYIDGDNASYNDFSSVHKEIKKYGRIIIGRIYGDWSTDAMNGWRDISINNAFESINCFSLSRKNSTDIHLICDVLQDLYNNEIVNTYIIVSSDSDFSHVTKRIRAAGKKVIGVGRNNTPKMLKNACDIFISNEVLKNDDIKNDEKLSNIIKSFKGEKKIELSNLINNLSNMCDIEKKYGTELNNFDKYLKKNYFNYFRVENFKKEKNIYNIIDIKDTIKNLFEISNDEYFNISKVKDGLLRSDPTFDQRNYGCSSMKYLLEKFFNFDYEIFQKNSGYYIKKK